MKQANTQSQNQSKKKNQTRKQSWESQKQSSQVEKKIITNNHWKSKSGKYKLGKKLFFFILILTLAILKVGK